MDQEWTWTGSGPELDNFNNNDVHGKNKSIQL